ncbi:MAG: 6-carboxytetrahydropterin synthase QueD [Candidatus Omnitrophica bacterium]|nr:6-carboxytetrahydropterin synthase QueD [Candidatus Omnitrophota bacterium]
MYTIKVRSKFSSAHNLRGHKGKCEALHGHNWNVEVAVSSAEVDDMGMVLDFTELKKILNETTGDLDHKYLNEIEYFKEVNPTSENIARYVYEKILFKNPDLKISEVIVWETDTSSASYSA